MLSSSSRYGGHSAQVDIELVLNETVLSVNQLGPGFLLLDAAEEHPPSEGTLRLRIDGAEQQWTVRLPDGISIGSQRVAIFAC